MNTPTRSLLRTLALTALFAASAHADELLRDGGFAGTSGIWQVAPALGGWNPITDGAAALHPPTSGRPYSGPVLYQNLNVAVSGGQTVTVKARVKKSFAPAGGASVTLAADYLTAAGQTHRFTLVNPPNDSLTDFEFVNVARTVNLPADAVKVVRFIAAKSGYGEFTVDDLSLDGASLTPGTVPRITSLSPAAGPYNSAQGDSFVTLTGSGFGTQTGQVRIAVAPLDQPSPFGGSGSLPVVSWADDRVVARVTEPARSGKIWILAGGVEADGAPVFTVTSPHFTVDAVAPTLTLIKGQTGTAVFKVAFFNGFTTAGGISLLPVMPVPGGPSAPLSRPGGIAMDFSTADLQAGTYQGVVQSLEDRSFARFASFDLNIATISAIKVFEWDTMGMRTELQAKTVAKQGSFALQLEALDQNGVLFGGAAAVGFGVPPITVTSSNPQVVTVYPGNFGPQFYAEENGTAVLTLRTPDGFTREFPVTVAAPSAPRVLSIGVSPPIVPNDGLQEIVFGASATENITVGYQGFIQLVGDDVVWSDENRSAIRRFKIQPGTPPGDYLFTAGTGGLGVTTSDRVVALRVVNAPGRGAVTGAAHVLDPSAGGPDGAMGVVEFYRPDGTLVASNRVDSYTSTTYLADYVPSGTYRVRYAPAMTTLAPQWWPNAASLAEASDVTVAAGQTVGGIDFFLDRAAEAPVPDIPAPVIGVSGAPSFALTTTTSGKSYFLEFKRALAEAVWQEAARVTGDGGPKTLADTASADPVRFYRLRVE